MYQTNFAVYLGQEDEKIFVGFSADQGFFIVLKVDEGLDKERGRDLLKRIGVVLEQASIRNLNDFETFLAEKFKETDIPAGFSCAAGLQRGEIFLLKTVGTGQIYLKRGRDFARLIGGDNSASGYIAQGDFFIFTTQEFAQTLGEDKLKNIIDGKRPHEVLETITPQLKTQNDTGMISLFVSFEQEQTAEVELKEEVKSTQASIRNRLSTTWVNIKTQLQTQDKQKRRTFFIVGIILVVFIWSVFLGVQRRVGSQSQKKINSTREVIEEKLRSAEEVAFLNLPRAIVLINESKTRLSSLKKEVRNPNDRNIRELEKLITDKEASILKKEEKKAEEFFDLSVEDKNASGQKMYLDGENLAVLDPQGAIYILSLSKKSLDRRVSTDAKAATIISEAQDKIYVFRKGAGVFQITPDGKSTKVIDNDPQWKDVTNLITYNNNLYLLDRGGDQVYKYLVAENGFSQKSSYFEAGQSADLQGANSLAIDASVYIGLQGRILKYVSGVQDTFNTSFPEENSKLTKIFTSKDLEKVYGWDKDKGALYVIDKTGTYERQIDSSVLKNAADLAVFGSNAYILSGSKIYILNVE